MADYKKVEQGLRAMAHNAGLQVLGVTHKNHFKVEVKAPDGRTGTIIAGCTPSDRRAVLNQQARFNRFARGLDVYPTRGNK